MIFDRVYGLVSGKSTLLCWFRVWKYCRIEAIVVVLDPPQKKPYGSRRSVPAQI